MDDGHDLHVPLHQRRDQYADALGEVVPTSASPERSQRSLPHPARNQVPSSAGYCGSRVGDYAPVSLPPYIKRLPAHIGQRDMEYLAEKDAMTIPDDDFRDELLRTYVKIIHCFMPAIDLDEFLDPIINGDEKRPVSLLLFQAVMFASVIFVDGDLLRSRGYTSRKRARKVFFNRVRLLYGLDCEPDRVALIQSVLLMTYWYDSPHDEKDTWYWMGIALSLSQIMGLHRDPETLKISLRAKRLRRRIWWACFIRDRLLALGIRRPARIRQEDFNVSMLELDDFDLCQPTKEHVAFVRECGFTTVEEDGRRQMCQICIDLAKLCVCIGNILHSQYSVVSTQPLNWEYYKNIAVLPRYSDKQMSELSKCDSELEDWCYNRKATSRYSPPSPPASTSGSLENTNDWADNITWLHQALLRMIYLTALGALHRPRALMSSSSRPESPDTNNAKKTSLRKVKEAAVAMTKLAFDLQCENQLRYLSTSSVPAFLSATLIHLLDIRDPDEELRNLSIGRFYQCFHALYELQDMYASADYAIRFLETVLVRMGTHIPMLPILRMCTNTMTTHSRDSHHIPFLGAANPVLNDPILEDYHASAISGRLNTPSTTGNGQFAMAAPPAVAQPSNAGQSMTNSDSYLNLVQQLSPELTMLDGTSPRPRNMLLFGGGGPRATPGLDSNAQLGPGTMGNPSAAAGDHPTMMDTPSQMDIWTEFDGLLPALINFDATDQNLMMQSHETRMPATTASSTSWQPFL
ncbi:putative c6 transcription factor protein [Phaeoacremonium minimum UCRPA7]|uniref:Putative c6 transcription factor protein n=1 Tax=Phaeoacremonium minimum (strain UCR-PA7) TaxID=1286976 RepID=R8BGG5_PHAM7|nr:putative c6 transcription factor protein [Phaeoacremonium minimum UCRPA7]EON98413.1 putative c6 transcription factor protein [Phaeoacremonium minimum UCRPA7]